MKEKLLGALLALSPFKGNTQEAEIPKKDKVLQPIEQTQEKPVEDKRLKDKKTANPWKVSLEASLPLVNEKDESKSMMRPLETKSDFLNLPVEKIGQNDPLFISKDIFFSSVNTSMWFKDLNQALGKGDLGADSLLWQNYVEGKISLAEAAEKFKLSPGAGPLLKNFLMSSYFSQMEALEAYKLNGNDFSRGSLFMQEALASLKPENLSVNGLTEEMKKLSQGLSYEAKLGALSLFSVAISRHYNDKAGAENSPADLDKIIVNAVNYLQGDVGQIQNLGNCRHYAALVSELGEKGFGLEASVVTSARHALTQIKSERGVVLLDDGHYIESISGQPLLTKDDVDAALIKNFQEPTINDLTIEAGGDKVLYENRYNNFAGLMNELTNRKNLLRTSQFIAGSDKLDLFPRLSESGVLRGSIEKGNIGLQAYWLRNNNEYSRFMKDIKGLNLAAYIPADFSLGKKRFENIFFANLGFYRSVLDLAAASGSETKTGDATLSLENYLRCSLNASLTAGMITKLADFNLELERTGQQLNKAQRFEYRGSISPFISFEIPSGDKEKNGRAYLCSGLEITDYLALPDLTKISTIPWFQSGFEYNKSEIDLGLKLHGEFQPASSRFDLDSYLKKGANQFELRAFSEFYTQEFKKLTPYKDVAGIEAGIRHDLDNGHSLFLMLSTKTEGGEVKQVMLNVGFNF